MNTRHLKVESLDETLDLARGIGQRLKGGEVIELVSDLGGGKTAFVRGLADGMGSQDTVGSPTFTISRQYRAGDLTLYHFDFYRLNEPGIVADELAEVIDDPAAVIAVEWADIVEDVLPEKRLTIEIKTTGETQRDFVISCPGELAYLLPEVD
jgi:tRNA threonylcarbamoyladenosine biosynthesis protein TsaE